jgi:membrane protein implicated in regulation of membrane protease activity
MSAILFIIVIIAIILALILGAYLFGLVFYWTSNLCFPLLAIMLIKDGYIGISMLLLLSSGLTWAHTVKRIQKNKEKHNDVSNNK